MPFHRDEDLDPQRTRSAEGIGPRASELLADRLYAAAAIARLTDSRIQIDGAPVDTEALEVLAATQRREEDELLARWHHFRSFYRSYLATMRARESTLRRALDALAVATGERAAEPSIRSALRMCRLRRPPLAKVEALVARASGAQGALEATAGRRRLREK